MPFINTLYNLWPNGDERIPGLRDGIAGTAQAVFAKYGINSPLLVAHVMAQISHECGAGHEVIENLNYRAEQLLKQWPSHFTPAQASAMAHRPQQIANQAYNGRMGNRIGSDDGWNFRGRGGSQTTGREGYERVKKQTGLDVVNHPEYLIDPKYFLECAVSDFVNCGCLPYAKADDVVNVTKRLNGGTIGLAAREAWLDRWKAALGTGPVIFTSAGTARPPIVILPPGPTPPDVPGISGVRPLSPTGFDGPDPQVTPATQSVLAKLIAALIAAFRRK